jgi:FG-GAP-like repeat
MCAGDPKMKKASVCNRDLSAAPGHILAVFLLLCSVCGLTMRSQAENILAQLRDEALSYFKPLAGKVIAVKGNLITTDLVALSGVKKGMKLSILREGTSFLHPVTKEPIGRMETIVGKAYVRGIDQKGSTLEIIQGEAREGDIVRISETKVKVLFCQKKTVDWSLGESYYQLLKESGRFDLLDTPIDSGDDSLILEEAKRLGAHLALILSQEGSLPHVRLQQRLLWTDDSLVLSESEVKLDEAAMKEFRLGESMFPAQSVASDTMLYFDLPFGARFVVAGDVDGDGKKELILTHGRSIGVYREGVTLQNIYEIKGSATDEYLWIDVLDINGDGRDEVIVTSMRRDDVISSVYEFRGGDFIQTWSDKLFLRRFHDHLLGQGYRAGDGFEGPVFSLLYEQGAFRKGDQIKLPQGVNIYDFVEIEGSDGTPYLLAYDDDGFLNLYNQGGLRVWRSTNDMGGFLTTFKRSAPTIMTERGTWSVKDRLYVSKSEALAVKRIPFTNTARALGFKSSQIRAMSWTGFSMEERVLIDGISGSLLDYAVAGDRLLVLSKPLFGIKTKNILKGENPFGSMLYIFSMRGR